MQDFISSEHYYSTYFHELSHATGHSTRLNRFTDENFINRETYAQEDFIAEFSAAFVCGECGINNTHDQSAAYITGWKKAIKKNLNAVVGAISAAQKAADLILGNQYQSDNEVRTVNQPTEVTA
jgi:antirestriction protein ArdC